MKSKIESIDQLIDLFFYKFGSVEDVEHFFGIEFAFNNGKYLEECPECEGENIDPTTFRVLEPDKLPNEYPCVVVWWVENTYDRFGSVKIQLIEYVYQSDFNS